MAEIVPLPVRPRPRSVEDPVPEPLSAALDDSLRIGLVAGLVIGAALLPWLMLLDAWRPRRRP